MKIRNFLIVGFISALTAGCGDRNEETMSAEFRTLDLCLDGLKRSSKQSLKIITDKPGRVSGKLSNGLQFGCTKESSGTKGVYYEGFYIVKKK
jgi:hypothetical protein